MSQNETQQNAEKKAKNTNKRVPAPTEREKKAKIKRRVLSVVIAVAIAVVSFTGGICANWFSLDKEMRTLITVKKKIQKDYYQEISNEVFYDALFGAINEDLLDAYSGYMTPEELAALTKDLAGSRAGLGLVFLTKTPAGEDQMRVIRVCGNSPAEDAGITAGSLVVGFGATSETMVSSVSYDEFTAFLQDYDAGEKFYIQLQEDGGTRTVEISREEYVENYVFYRSATTAYAFDTQNGCGSIAKGNPLSALNNDTAYIRITQFTGNAAPAFTQAMHVFKAEGKKHLVLDLRGNGGGYLTAMQSIASYFCKTATTSTPIVAYADYGEKLESFRATNNLYYEFFQNDSRIYLLADGDSASASECLIGCMLDYGAIRYGDICLMEDNGVAKTYGKGIMQTTYFVSYIDRDAIKLTTARVLWPLTKNCIHDRGVLASDGTKTVARDYAGDAELINALAALMG